MLCHKKICCDNKCKIYIYFMMKTIIVISYKKNIVISYKLGQSNIFIGEAIIISCVKSVFEHNKNVWLVNKWYINMLKGKKKVHTVKYKFYYAR